MKNLGIFVLLIAATVTAPVEAAPGVLPLNMEELKVLKLDSIPPWPAEMVLKGTNDGAGSGLLHRRT